MPLPWFLDDEGRKQKEKKKKMEAKLALVATKRGAFDEEDDKTPLAMRFWLAEKWNKMSDSEKELVRSQRARRGVRCEICGTVGYYRETCINNCHEETETPDSLGLTPPPSPSNTIKPNSPAPQMGVTAGMGAGEKDVGLGILWGSMGFQGVPLEALGEKSKGHKSTGQEKKKKHVKRKADLAPMRGESQERLTDLRISDKSVHPYEYFTRAEEGYNRTLPELTLHQVLRKIMRIVEDSINENVRNLEAKHDQTLLHPPALPDAETFYPAAMGKMKQYTDYFALKKRKEERTERQAYKFQGALRPADGLDALFRGQGSKEADMAANLALYKVDPKAGQSAHAKIGWKSNLATNDLLAVADPAAAVRAQQVENLFTAQGAWAAKQKIDMEQRNDRFEHLVFIIRKELSAEHEREARELSAEGKAPSKQAQMDVFLERVKAVDHLMEVLKLYGLVGTIEETDMLFLQLNKWKETLQERLQATKAASKRPVKWRGHAAAAAVAADANRLRESTSNDENISRVNTADTTTTDAEEQTEPMDDAKERQKGGLKPGAVKSNALIAKGENPYYEADLYIEKHKRLSRRLARQGGFESRQPSRYRTLSSPPLSPSPSARTLNGNTAISTATNGNVEIGARSPGGAESVTSADDESVYTGTADGDDNSTAVGSTTAAFDLLHGAAHATAIKLRRQQEETTANIILSKTESDALKAEDKRRADMKNRGWKAKSFVRQYAKPQREIDEEEMAKARKTFEEVDFGHHIRKGNRLDVAYLRPTLIPVPGAFEGDGKHHLSSYVGEQIITNVRKDLISDLGYTPQHLLPLYVRNTLIEPNGTSTGGDQTQEVMALDRRYSHYVGRPLNRFEPGKQLHNSKEFLRSSKGFGPNAKELAERLAPIKAARAARAKAQRIEEMKFHPLNRSLVRVVFGLPIPSSNDVIFAES